MALKDVSLYLAIPGLDVSTVLGLWILVVYVY